MVQAPPTTKHGAALESDFVSTIGLHCEYMKTLGERIRELREQKDISLRELAKKLDLSAAFLSDVELGRRFPSDDVLAKIAKQLDQSVKELEAFDTRPPMEALKRLTSSNPLMGVALRRVVEKNVSASELIALLKKVEKRK
jgi:transcriptional regulator with XRE-family HTH domain